MLLYSASIFTLLVMFSGLILALPKTNHLEDRSDLSTIPSRQGNRFSLSSNIAFFSNKRKRPLPRGGRIVKPGVKCDGTFYKESKVENIANKACEDSYHETGFAPPKSALSRMFTRSQKPFTGSAHMFPNESPDGLTMLRITHGFFSTNMITAFLRQQKEDYVVLANNCKTVGVVRRISGNDFALCLETRNVPWLPEKPQVIQANVAY